MPLTTAKEKWLSLAARTKAILLATITLATIVSTVWVIDSRYAKAAEFKTLQLSVAAGQIKDQIEKVEDRRAHTNCRARENKDLCQWLDERLDYWQKQLRRLEQKR